MSDQPEDTTPKPTYTDTAPPAADPELWRHARWFEPHTAKPERVEYSKAQQRWLATCTYPTGPVTCEEVLYLREEFKPEDHQPSRVRRW